MANHAQTVDAPADTSPSDAIDPNLQRSHLLMQWRANLVVVVSLLICLFAWLQLDAGLNLHGGGDGMSVLYAAGGGGIIFAVLGTVVVAAVIAGAALIGAPRAALLGGWLALMMAAWAGGSMDLWVRTFGSPRGYFVLVVETLLWAAAAAAHLWLAGRIKPLKSMAAIVGQTQTQPWVIFRFGRHDLEAAGVALAVGVVGSIVLLQSSSAGQVSCGLFVAFLLAGVASRAVRHDAAVGLTVMCPFLVAAAAAVWTAMSFGSQMHLLAAWYAGDVIGPAMVLPVHVAGAGAAGVAAGLLWGDTFKAGDE